MTDSQQLTKFREVQQTLAERAGEINRLLPRHVSPERFQKAALIAIQSKPDLLLVPRGALFKAIAECAQDGLLPDGRQAALIPQKNKQTGQITVRYQPMVLGVKMLAWNSGELASWDARMAYSEEVRQGKFKIILGTTEKIEHEPMLEGDAGKPAVVYSVAKFKSGFISFDYMTIAEVERIRHTYSQQPNGNAWRNEYEEMCKKTILHRHKKSLPLSADLDRLMQRDAQEFGPVFDHQPMTLHAEEPPSEDAPAKPRRGRPKLSDFRRNSPQGTAENDPPAHSPGGDSRSGQEAPPPADHPARNGASVSEELDLANRAESAGYDAYFNGKAGNPIPKEFLSSHAAVNAYRDGLKRGWQESQAGDDEDTRGAE